MNSLKLTQIKFTQINFLLKGKREREKKSVQLENPMASIC